MELIQKIDVTSARRVFTCGDIHGCYGLLEAELNTLGFDDTQDVLIAVGDLVDRGPENERFEEFLEYPWFYSVRGNHEEMCRPEFAGTDWHTMNGGSWYNQQVDEFGREVIERAASKLFELPFAIEATRGSKKYGFVHAGLAGVDDWNNLERELDRCKHMMENPFLWDRHAFYRARERSRAGGDDSEFFVDNIDHVYFGHTPVNQPLTVGNCSWIDTGAFATKNITVLEIK